MNRHLGGFAGDGYEREQGERQAEERRMIPVDVQHSVFGTVVFVQGVTEQAAQ